MEMLMFCKLGKQRCRNDAGDVIGEEKNCP